MTNNIAVPAGAAGQRLDVYLATRLQLPRTEVQRRIKAGLISISGAIPRASLILAGGETVIATEPESTPPISLSLSLPVVYQDGDVCIVDKPAGITVHPGNGRQTEATVVTFARTVTTDDDEERPGIVHRLDRETSGLLVIARSRAAKTALQEEWQAHRVKKTYTLLTIGHVSPLEGVIDLALDRDPARPTRRRVSTTGRPAVTRYSVLQDFVGYSLVQAYPLTGRTHQIRAHFAAIGHPVAGDTVYGPKHRALGLKRQFLHASALTLTLPSGKELTVESPLPEELERLLKRLDPGLY